MKDGTKISYRTKLILQCLRLRSSLMLGVGSYSGELVNKWVFPVQCGKAITQNGTLSSLGLHSMGKHNTAVIRESINPWTGILMFPGLHPLLPFPTWEINYFLLVSVLVFWASIVAQHFLVLVNLRLSSLINYLACTGTSFSVLPQPCKGVEFKHSTFCSLRCTHVTAVLFNTMVSFVAVMSSL